jgi:hypothetical protein
MSESKHLSELRARIEELRRSLLPADFVQPADYPNEQTCRTFGFRLLAHAEIEHYLEDRVEEIAKAAIRAWDHANLVSRPLLALACFSGLASEPVPSAIVPKDPKRADEWERRLMLNERAKSSVTEFMTRVRKNHGIKEENVLALLIPVGFQASRLDLAWLAICNSFGAARGEAAHRSGIRVSSLPDPATEYGQVKFIVDGLVPVDAELTELLRSASVPVPNGVSAMPAQAASEAK